MGDNEYLQLGRAIGKAVTTWDAKRADLLIDVLEGYLTITRPSLHGLVADSIRMIREHEAAMEKVRGLVGLLMVHNEKEN